MFSNKFITLIEYITKLYINDNYKHYVIHRFTYAGNLRLFNLVEKLNATIMINSTPKPVPSPEPVESLLPKATEASQPEISNTSKKLIVDTITKAIHDNLLMLVIQPGNKKSENIAMEGLATDLPKTNVTLIPPLEEKKNNMTASDILEIITKQNELQTILNADIFDPLKPDDVIILVQVCGKKKYRKYLVENDSLVQNEFNLLF